MNTTDDQSDTCADCGAPLNGTSHTCSEAQETLSDDTNPRIQIPAEIWSTGLVRPAWGRGPDLIEEPADDTPAKVTSGTLLSRPGDLADVGDPSADPSEINADQVEDEPHVTEDTSAEDVESDPIVSDAEESGPAAAPDDAQDDPTDASTSEVDSAFVVPTRLINGSTGAGHEHFDSEPFEDELEPEGELEPEDEVTDGQVTEDEAFINETFEDESFQDESFPDESFDEVEPESEEPEPEDELVDPAQDELDEAEWEDAEWDIDESDESDETTLSPIAAAEAAAATAATSIFHTADEPVLTSHPSAAMTRGPDVRGLTPPPLPPPPPPTRRPAPAPVVTQTVEVVDDTSRKRGKRWPFVLLVLVLLAAAAAGGWVWWQRSQDEPIRESFVESNAAFIDASATLTAATTVEEIATAAQEFAPVSEQLSETADAAAGRTSSLATSVQRAVEAQLQVSQAAEQLTGLSAEEFGGWGETRGALTLGLQRLDGVETDISAAGGSTDGLPTRDFIASTDTVIGDAAQESAERLTATTVQDLKSARTIKDLRETGTRATEGASDLTAALDSLVASEVDTAQVTAYAAVQTATAKLTRLRPVSLNQWQPIRTQVKRAASDLPDEGRAVNAALGSADTMVQKAITAWTAWEESTEAARTEKKDDIASIREARETVGEVVAEYEQRDTALAALLASDTPFRGKGPGGQAFRKLDAAASARTALSARIADLDSPPEIADEFAALRAAIDANAASVRAAADAAAACLKGCTVRETPAWGALVSGREGQLTAFIAAGEAWRTAVPKAIKEIRKRPLPDRPKI